MLSILASAILLQTPEEGKLFVPVFTAYSNSKKAPLTKEGVDFQKDQYKVELTWIGRLSKGQLELRLPEVKGGFDWTIGDIRVKSKPVAKVRIAKEGYYKIVVNPAKGVNQW